MKSTHTRPRLKVYITDRDDNGRLFDYLVAVDGEHPYDVEIAPHLTVLPDDGLTRNGKISTPQDGGRSDQTTKEE